MADRRGQDLVEITLLPEHLRLHFLQVGLSPGKPVVFRASPGLQKNLILGKKQGCKGEPNTS
jgi:hypothetical protein